jgi:hypothetical protein
MSLFLRPGARIAKETLVMLTQHQYQSRLQAAVRKMIKRKMTVRCFVTHDGKMIHNVNGYNLTGEQILELDSKRQLTAWGIAEFARRYAGE